MRCLRASCLSADSEKLATGDYMTRVAAVGVTGSPVVVCPGPGGAFGEGHARRRSPVVPLGEAITWGRHE